MSPVPVSLEVSWLPSGTLTCFLQNSSHQPLSLLYWLARVVVGEAQLKSQRCLKTGNQRPGSGLILLLSLSPTGSDNSPC